MITDMDTTIQTGIRISRTLYDRLKGAGAEVSAYCVDDAEHEGNFWSPEVRQAIWEELIERLFPAD